MLTPLIISLLIVSVASKEHFLGYHDGQEAPDHGAYMEEDDVDIPLGLGEAYAEAYRRLTAKAHTAECKKKIMTAFQEYWESFLYEAPMPFERQAFHSQCPMDIHQDHWPALKFEDESYPEPPPSVSIPRREVEQVHPSELAILYIFLVHQHPGFVLEIIEALHEPMHTFVLHVDTKSPSTFQHLLAHVNDHENSTMRNVFIVQEGRVETNWGAYSIVNATLRSLRVGLQLNRSFDFVIDISGTTFPIKSKEYIRSFLSQNVNAIYNGYSDRPAVPLPELLHSYVECDGFVHRVARLTRPRGISVFIGSQWFAIPRHVAEWLLTDPLPLGYKEYAEHIVVADEQYFATMFMNSPYCADMVNKDLNYLIFTDWQSERGNIHKCLDPDPLRCGRSPTTLTLRMLPAVQMSMALFARKFDPQNADSMALLSLIKRNLEKIDTENGIANAKQEFLSDIFDGGPVCVSETSRSMIVMDNEGEDECLRFPDIPGDVMEVVPCDVEDKAQQFKRSDCIYIDSFLFSEFRGPIMQEQTGEYSPERYQEYCALKGTVKGKAIPGLLQKHEHLCMDIADMSPSPNADIIGYPCRGTWNQYFAYSAESGTISSTMPRVVAEITGMSTYHSSKLCLQGILSCSGECGNRTPIELKTSFCSEELSIESGGGMSKQKFKIVHPETYFNKNLHSSSQSH